MFWNVLGVLAVLVCCILILTILVPPLWFVPWQLFVVQPRLRRYVRRVKHPEVEMITEGRYRLKKSYVVFNGRRYYWLRDYDSLYDFIHKHAKMPVTLISTNSRGDTTSQQIHPDDDA